MSCPTCGLGSFSCVCATTVPGFQHMGTALGGSSFGPYPVGSLYQQSQLLQQQLQNQNNTVLGPPNFGGGSNMTVSSTSVIHTVPAMAGWFTPVPSPKEPLKHDGVQVGEIIGWRIWHLKRGYLTSYSMPIAWFPDQPMSGVPDDYGAQGIWSFKTSHHALHKLLSEGPDRFVMGSVYLWGEIIEHTIGYRAEYAKVRSIDVVPKDDPRLLEILRKRYKVEDNESSYGT